MTRPLLLGRLVRDRLVSRLGHTGGEAQNQAEKKQAAQQSHDASLRGSALNRALLP